MGTLPLDVASEQVVMAMADYRRSQEHAQTLNEVEGQIRWKN